MINYRLKITEYEWILAACHAEIFFDLEDKIILVLRWLDWIIGETKQKRVCWIILLAIIDDHRRYGRRNYARRVSFLSKNKFTFEWCLDLDERNSCILDFEEEDVLELNCICYVYLLVSVLIAVWNVQRQTKWQTNFFLFRIRTSTASDTERFRPSIDVDDGRVFRLVRWRTNRFYWILNNVNNGSKAEQERGINRTILFLDLISRNLSPMTTIRPPNGSSLPPKVVNPVRNEFIENYFSYHFIFRSFHQLFSPLIMVFELHRSHQISPHLLFRIRLNWVCQHFHQRLKSHRIISLPKRIQHHHLMFSIHNRVLLHHCRISITPMEMQHHHSMASIQKRIQLRTTRLHLLLHHTIQHHHPFRTTQHHHFPMSTDQHH